MADDPIELVTWRRTRDRGDYEILFDSAVGNAIAERRARKDLTQTELANMVGVHRNQVYRWERGDQISYWMFLRVCDALCVQPDTLTPRHHRFLGEAIRQTQRERDGMRKPVAHALAEGIAARAGAR